MINFFSFVFYSGRIPTRHYETEADVQANNGAMNMVLLKILLVVMFGFSEHTFTGHREQFSLPLSQNAEDTTYVERTLNEQALRYKTEANVRKGAFITLVGASIIINIVHTLKAVFSLFSSQQCEGSKQASFFSAFTVRLLQLFQSALATYVLHRAVQHTFKYYCYKHPISWLLDFRVKIKDHFDELLCIVANQETNILSGEFREHAKQYLQLFVKIISKDTKQICAFMQYRSTLVPDYKQPTILLIQNNILAFLSEWAAGVDILLDCEIPDFRLFAEKTVLYGTLLYEQIDFFKKIDKDVELIREIVTAILQPTP